MALQRDGWIGAGNDLLDADLRDLAILEGPAGTFLYASSGQNGGISVYRVDGPGGLASLSDTRYFTTSGITMGSFDLVSLDGVARLIMGGTGNGALVGYGFETDGDLSGLVSEDLPGSGVETARVVASAALSNDTTALYMVDGDTGALAAYVSDGAGAIAASAGLTGGAGTFDLDGAVALEVVSAGNVSYLVAASGADSGSVRSYRIDADSGALEYVDSLGAEDGLGIGTPSAMQTIVAYGATWVILGAAGSGSLSVMKLAADGQLEPADHILDTLATRFGGVSALEVVQVGAQVFVLAGGADDGLALFSLLPDGRLVHMQSLAQTTGAGLENVTGIEAVQVGDELRIFVTSGAALGLSQFSLPLDDLGSVIQSTGVEGGQVSGTGAADLILGAGVQEQLIGQGGDDILVAGAAGTVLTGGGGGDIFVLGPATGTLQISDFEPGTDRLDLSGFAMLRSISQLDLTPTGTGITIEYGPTTIEVLSNDGQSLSAADLWPGGFDTPDRVPVPPGPVIQVMLGTAEDDTLTGGAEANFIRGLEGNDTILGKAGDDEMWGEAGTDTIYGEAGNDTIFGGADRDILWGGEGRDVLWGGAGNDTLRGVTGDDQISGEAGDDQLFGGAGNDSIFGEAGNDTLYGGAGRDVLWGGEGDEIIFGGGANDTSFGGEGNDTIYGGAGNDTSFGGAGRDILWGGNGRDVLWGGEGNDTLRGVGGDDQISGGAGDDQMFGGDGADRLTGGAGNDRLTGGAGPDVFIFASSPAHGNDRISDFADGQDLIRIDIAGAGFEDLILTGTGSDTVIDTGAGTITLNGVMPDDLSASDFLFS